MLRIAVTLLLFLPATLGIRAQSTPDLNGTWQLNAARSSYGDRPGPSSRTDIVELHDGVFRDAVTAVFRHKTRSYTLTCSTDGKETVFAPGAGINLPYVTLNRIAAVWRNGSLELREGLTFEAEDFLEKDTYTLSADGHTLSVAVSVNNSPPIATYSFDRE